MKRLVIPVLVLIFGSGCGPDLAALAKELKGDTATVCDHFSMAGGSNTFLRTNIADGEVACGGLTVKRTAPPAISQVGIPVTITPEISVGAPRIAPR